MADKENNRNETPDAADQRRQAEAKLAERRKKTGPLPSMDADIRRLVHELEVHQIEMEMQNEELMQARAEREAVLKQYTDLYDFAPMGYFTLARDGTIRMANLTGANLLGVERGKLIERRFGQFVNDEYRTAFSDFLGRIFECKEKESFQVELCQKDGEPRWVQIEAICLDNEQECRVTLADITARKKVEEQIRFQVNILEAVGQAVIATDNSGIITYWNRYAESLYGWPAAEAVGKKIMDVNVSQATKKQAAQIMTRLQAGESWSGEFQVQRRDGTTFSALVTNTPILDEQGGLIGIIGVSSDISERKKVEDALRASEERYRTLINQIPAIVYVDDFSSAPALTQYVSPYIETMLGFTPEEWVAGGFDLWKERLHPEDRDRVLAEYDRMVPQDNGSLNCEYRLLNKEGQVVWVLDRASVLHDPQGNPTLLHGVIHDITERKQAEFSLKESQATFLAALSSMTDAIFISDKDGQLIEFNDAFVSFHKFKDRAKCFRWLSEYPDILDVYLDNGELAPLEMWAIPRALRGETVTEAEYTLHRKDIDETWIGSYNFAPIRNNEEEIVGAVVVARDITERVKVRKTILENEKRFSTIFQANPVAISLRNFTDGSCLDVNQAYLRLTGFSSEQARKQSILNMGIWRNPAEFEKFKKILDKKRFLKNVEVRLLTKTGAGRDVLASYEKIQLNGKDCVLASFQDVTELKQSQQKLQTANQTLEKAQQVARLGSWTWNIQTNELQWSDEMYRVFGIEKETFSGDLADVMGKAIHPDDRDKVEKSNLSVINDKKPYPLEYRVLRPDGSVRHVYAEAGDLVLDKDGNPAILTGIAQDITERKQVEQALRESHQQLRAISTYWQNAIEAERAHISREIHDEFGQSMTALKMDLNWLAKRLPDEDDKLKRISGMGVLVDESITLMRRIATDLHPNLLDDLGLNAALEWQTQEFTRRSEIPCKLKLPESELVLDPALITTIFRLVQETLTNISRHAEATKVEVSMEQIKQELILIIRDNGRGISIDELSNPRSLGLLSLRERAAQWGGETIIRGKPGTGTIVTVRIPLPDPTKSAGKL